MAWQSAKIADFTYFVLYLKVTIFFNAKYLENGTRCSYTYNDRLIGSHISYGMVPLSMTFYDPNPNLKGTRQYSMLNI